MKVALTYDKVNKWGGAERVLLALHKLFPDAPLYTSVYDKKNAKWADVFDVRVSFLQNIPFAQSNSELLALFMPMAFESFTFDEYDLVISVTSEAAKGIITKPGTKHLCYCLTPTRYLWSGFSEYFTNDFFRFLAMPLIWYLRRWDKVASARPDVFIAISEEVQRRIKKYYARDSELIYPLAGLQIGSYNRHSGDSEPSTEDSRISKGRNQRDPGQARMTDYFLVVSRLSKFTKYKRIDLAIDACNKLKLPLKIIGSGSWVSALKETAGPTIEFVGRVSDEALAKYYQNCKALIFPGSEDLGLVMIEAQQFGKPVIAFRDGGALEIIFDKKTGIFFDKPNALSLVAALEDFENYKFDSKACVANAERFEFSKFEQNFLSVVNKSI